MNPDRTVILLCGPAGAGKTTTAREGAHRHGLDLYDRDDARWTSEKQFTDALARLARNPRAHAVVIRSGASSSARAKAAHLMGATHTYLITLPARELSHRVAHRNRADVRNGLASINTWIRDHDRDDHVPDFPGWENIPMGRGRRHTEAAERLKTTSRERRRPCWLCGQAIDYDAAWPDPNSFSMDHIKPRATHPDLEHEPTNHAPAHLGCNTSRQADAPAPGLGTSSRAW